MSAPNNPIFPAQNGFTYGSYFKILTTKMQDFLNYKKKNTYPTKFEKGIKLGLSAFYFLLSISLLLPPLLPS
jgi:hypothetical protein